MSLSLFNRPFSENSAFHKRSMGEEGVCSWLSVTAFKAELDRASEGHHLRLASQGGFSEPRIRKKSGTSAALIDFSLITLHPSADSSGSVL